jgi:low affinity Fe/Cu permease
MANNHAGARANLGGGKAPQAASSALQESEKRLSKTKKAEAHVRNEWFATFAHGASRITGKPLTFIIAVILVMIWAATGPYFRYSDTWQLVINTSTTIITFLMVFLIQNTQNRDTMALQLKLSELILCINEAEDRFAGAEDLSEEELESLHEELRKRADTTLGALNQRRAGNKKAS